MYRVLRPVLNEIYKFFFSHFSVLHQFFNQESAKIKSIKCSDFTAVVWGQFSVEKYLDTSKQVKLGNIGSCFIPSFWCRFLMKKDTSEIQEEQNASKNSLCLFLINNGPLLNLSIFISLFFLSRTSPLFTILAPVIPKPKVETCYLALIFNNEN